MKIIMGGRGFGKTTKLIQMSAETKAVILVTSISRSKEILRMASTMGLDIPTPCPVCKRETLRGQNYTLLIDDLEQVIQFLFAPLEIDAVTLGYEGVVRLGSPYRYACIHGYPDELDCPDCGH